MQTTNNMGDGFAEAAVANSGFVPDMNEMFESEASGTSSASPANLEIPDELEKKGTAGQDAQGRRNKDEDEDAPLPKGTAGQDAQGRRNKDEDDDAPLAKGTAGQDAQGRRN